MSGSNTSPSQQQPEVENDVKAQPFVPAKEGHYHNTFIKYLIMFISACGSVFYTTFLCTGAVLNHWKDKLLGREKFVPPDIEQRSNGYVPRKPYDNLAEMKPSRDLQYYLKALGLDLEEYQVTTCDGFILTVHRIIDPKETDEQRQLRKPVFMQHGLLSCSGTWVVNGKNSLGYYFHEQGYDVWLGNNRSYFKAQHATMTGDLYNKEEYWDWGVQELACYDLPAMIGTVLENKKKHKKLILLGHLQGGLQSFLMLKNPYFAPLHDKIELFCHIAPAIYPGSLFYTRDFIKFINRRSQFTWLMLFGCCAFMRNLCLVRHYIAEYSLFGKLSYYMFKYLFGWNASNWGKDKKIWHFLFIFNMSYASVELMKYYLSRSSGCGFTRMLQPKAAYKNDDHFNVNVIDDTKSFFQFDKTWFEGVKVPMAMFIGDEDFLVDGKKVASHMRKYEPGYVEGENLKIVSLPTYNHLDVVWAEDIIGTTGYVIMDELKKLEEKQAQQAPAQVEQPIESTEYNTLERVPMASSDEEVLNEKDNTLAEEDLGVPEFKLKDKPIIPVEPLVVAENVAVPQSVSAS
ncbi:Sterol esterase 1 [Candida viswanathii]|uniref:Sterol esterase 1 n=1 Tax=Candida viswanathii TaxID=5486 RepID=A0A367YM12_9ASCO|nr:Sterol esterase 1 [Candida viswanathii]